MTLQSKVQNKLSVLENYREKWNSYLGTGIAASEKGGGRLTLCYMTYDNNHELIDHQPRICNELRSTLPRSMNNSPNRRITYNINLGDVTNTLAAGNGPNKSSCFVSDIARIRIRPQNLSGAASPVYIFLTVQVCRLHSDQKHMSHLKVYLRN